MEHTTYESIVEYNAACGIDPAPIGTSAYYNGLLEQLDKIQEISNGIFESVQARDLEGVILGAAQLDFASAGMGELTGCEFESVAARVTTANTNKLTDDIDEAYDHAEKLSERGMECYTYHSENLDGYHCVKRCSDDRVISLPGRPTADVSDLVPEPVDEYVIVVHSLSSQAEVLERVTKEYPNAATITKEKMDSPELLSILEEREYIVVHSKNGQVIDVICMEEDA